jgi:hypothetical protein
MLAGELAEAMNGTQVADNINSPDHASFRKMSANRSCNLRSRPRHYLTFRVYYYTPLAL